MARKVKHLLPGCRCEACRVARNAYERARYHRKQAERRQRIAEAVARLETKRRLKLLTQSVPYPVESPLYRRFVEKLVNDAA